MINSKILKGVEIMDGGSIIMPILIRVDDTITSMSIKGIYTRKPIQKAAFSSEATKAGTITVMGRFTDWSSSSSVAGGVSPAILQNSSRLAGAVLRSMNSFSGTWARLKNSSCPMVPAT